MKISEFRLDRAIVGAFILVVGTYFAFTHNVKNANAVVNASGLTAQYGCLLSRNTSAFSALMTGHSGHEGTNMIFNINYSNNTIGAVMTGNTNYNSNSALTFVGDSTGTFTETAYPGITNTYKVVSVFPWYNNSTVTFTYYITPVNSGKTLLLSSAEDGQANAPWSGVCQQV